jgi:hypothetical protein
MAAVLALHLTGGAANADPNASLGGVSSSVAISGTPANNLFDDVAPAEATAGDIEYRALDIKNTGDASAVVIKAFMDPVTSSPSTVLAFGIGASPIGSTLSIANESTAPAGVSFANYTPGSKLTIPDIPAGNYARLWIRRTVTAGAVNAASDQGTINVDYA